MQKNKNNAAAPSPRRSAKTRSFRRSETAKATHKTTERQSGRQSRPGLRSKLKKGLEDERELARRSASKPFFNQTAAAQPQPTNRLDGFSVSLLTQKRNVSPSPVISRTQPQSPPNRPWAAPPPARRSARDRAAGNAWRKSRSQRQNRPCP